jgi:hypothetical protein
MWDWEKVPKEKIDAIRAALKESPSPAKFKDYSEVAVSTRMEIAERVYKVLNKDDAFWEDFYRVMGFHYAAEHKTAQATAARRKALALTEARMNRPENAGERKKELMIAAAMHHFLGEDDVALRQLQELSTLTYSAGGDKENAKGLDEYLNKLAKDYQEQIKAGKVPDGFSSE